VKLTPIDVAGYERVEKAEDPETGLVAFIGVHDTTLGPALGGLRLWPYEDHDAALTDVLRLSRGMTFKSALARTGLGGGKAVIAARREDKEPALFEAMGRFIDTFGGTYVTAEDVNVGIDDLRAVRRSTSHVCGLTREEGGGGSPGPYTAYGCFLGLRETLRAATGDASLEGRTVALQGAGSVGFGLGRRLVDAGARLVVADVNDLNVERAVDELGATAVDPEQIYDVECDVFAPCALGGSLNAATIPRLRAVAVAGAANNQLLDEDRDAALLRDRGIVYAPDYVINAGGIVNVACELLPGGYDEQAALRRIERIPEALGEIFDAAAERGITTDAAAHQLAEAALADGRAATHP
jgi:leucine dehydrogenase